MIINQNKNNTNPYDILYLEPNVKLHQFAFSEFIINTDYTYFSLVNAYMQSSTLRERMDLGSWSALNSGCLQLLHSMDYSLCEKKEYSENINEDISDWVAEIYTVFQWIYNLRSKDINSIVPAKELYNMYDELSKLSIPEACKEIYERYFEKEINSQIERND